MTMIQVRNVPEEIHRTLKARAAHAGMTLSDYLLRELVEIASRPTNEEIVERLRRRKPVRTRTRSADVIRELREQMG